MLILSLDDRRLVQRLIDDYYELIWRHVSSPDEDRRAVRSACA
jgi:hypothetical protein